MPESQVGFKELIAAAKKDPAVMITAVIVFLGLLYYLYKKGQGTAATSTTPPDASSQPGQFAGTTGSYTFVEDIHQTPGPTPGPPGSHQPPPPGGGYNKTATIRPKHSSGPDAQYDSTHTGVPVQLDPTGYHPTGQTLPFGSKVKLIGPSVTGGLNRPGGSTQWYPISGGYLSAWDIASIR